MAISFGSSPNKVGDRGQGFEGSSVQVFGINGLDHRQLCWDDAFMDFFQGRIFLFYCKA